MINNFKRFDIVLVDFGSEAIDSEQSGIRPGLIVQNDMGNTYSSTTIVLPLSTVKKKLTQPTHALIKKGKEKGLEKDSVLLGECIRQISEKRIIKYMGRVTNSKEQKAIKAAYDANFGE